MKSDEVQVALAGAEKFTGAASAKTWVFPMLKNKIIAELRRRVRQAGAGFHAAGDFGVGDRRNL